MPRTPTRIAGPLFIRLVANIITLFTVPASQKYIIRQIHLENPSGAAVLFTLTIGADQPQNKLFDAVSIAANSAIDFFCYHILEATETMKTYAGTDNVLVIVINGDVCTLG